ncbi:MAG: DNA helicase RecQ [bacterium]
MKTILKKYFGYDEFRPLQAEAIESVLDNKDVLVVLPTGGGKSLIYQIPAMAKEGIVLVFSPLISLMKDQVDELNTIGIPAAFLNSTLTIAQQRETTQKIQNQEIQILYIAPERFFIPQFQEFLKGLDISLIAIDEAHCISEWGHDFRPEYRKLSALKTIFPKIPLIALTATATKQVQNDIIKQLNPKKMTPLIGSFERENLSLYVGKKQDLTEQIIAVLNKRKNKSGIIYCATRKKTESISKILNEMGYQNLPYHAGMSSQSRTANQNAFLKENANLMVATVAFGMGINKSNIRFVIHANLPKSIEAYYQEIGRAGRDGLPSDCYLFYSSSDIATQEFLIGQSTDPTHRHLSFQKLREMERFVRDCECRHKYILNYFGEERSGYQCLKKCDICLSGKIEETDITIEAQKILSCIFRVPYPVGVLTIAQILNGSNAKRTTRFQNLSTFGIMKDKTQDEIKDIVDALIDKELVNRESGKYPTLTLNKNSWKILTQNQKVIIKTKEVQEIKQEIDHEIELFELLKQWRRETANKENVPSFVIFSDKVLTDLSTYLPFTEKDLKKIPGIGEKKFEQYGSSLLTIINQFCQSKNIPSQIESLKKIRIPKTKTGYQTTSDTLSETYAFYQRGLSIEQIAQKRELKADTIATHIAELFIQKRVPTTELTKFISPKKIQNIKRAFKKIGGNPQSQQLRPIKDILPPDYTYSQIRLTQSVLIAEKK